jgi:hypothetical protein
MNPVRDFIHPWQLMQSKRVRLESDSDFCGLRLAQRRLRWLVCSGFSQTAWKENGRGVSLDTAFLLRDRFAVGLDWIYFGNMFQLPIGIAEKLFECEQAEAAEAAEEAAYQAAELAELLADEND